MPSGDERRVRVDALFSEALALPEAERHAFLEHATADDPSLAPEVEELLRLAADPAPGLAPEALAGSPLWEDLVGSPPPRSAASADLRVGAWRLISELGSGGMGTVWLAERADGQYQQKAALKLLQTGPQAQAVVDRFERERQILAGLDHPHIARLLDGGLTGEGRPWFAMEYVDGQPIDAYCDARKLSVEERLRLFIQVARAVQAAHGSLVVHRDLKPSNILVTRDGYPRLLDFGIAKPLDAPGDPEAATRTLLVLTPEYASPEQVRGEPARVASDVYQLGLLLYELLTGQRAQRLERPGPAELERVVCTHTPPLPSAIVAEGDGAATVARARRATPGGLRRKLRGDLDAIVMRALRKTPERRYSFVTGLVEDVERYLRELPVRAQPETLGYRASKFVQRHPVGVAAAVAIAVLLLAYATTITWQARQLARERDQVRIEAAKVEQMRDFLLRLFAAANPYGEEEGSVTVRELVEIGVQQVETEFAEEPEIRADMLGNLGEVLMGLADYERAERLLDEAVALQRELHGEDHPDVALALQRYSLVLSELDQDADAERFARDSLAMRRRLYTEPHEEVVDSLDRLATVEYRLGRYEESEARWREAIALRRALVEGDDADVATLLNNLGVALGKQERLRESEAIHREALAQRRRLYGRDHAEVSQSLNNLAVNLRNQGRYSEAETFLREALEVRRRVFGEQHPWVANTLHNLGVALRKAGKPDEAVTYHREALAIRRAVGGERHSNVAMSLHELANVARDRGEVDGAEKRYREALSMFRDTVPEGHPRIGLTALALGRLLLQRERIQGAEPLLEEALASLRSSLGVESGFTAQARVALGLCRARQGRTGEARSLLEAGLRVLDDSVTADPNLIAEGTSVLAALPPERL